MKTIFAAIVLLVFTLSCVESYAQGVGYRYYAQPIYAQSVIVQPPVVIVQIPVRVLIVPPHLQWRPFQPIRNIVRSQMIREIMYTQPYFIIK